MFGLLGPANIGYLPKASMRTCAGVVSNPVNDNQLAETFEEGEGASDTVLAIDAT